MAYFPTSALMPDYDSYAKSQPNILDSYSPTTVLSKLGQPVMYVLRHGNVPEDAEKAIRGLINPPLDDKGKKQVDAMVAEFGDRPISGVVTDDLKRTKQTAIPLAAEKGVQVEIDTAWRSWDVGTELEGQPIDEHKEEIEDLKENPDKIPVGGQSWGEFRQQVTSAFYSCLRRSMEGDPLVIVTHGSDIQIIYDLLGEETETTYAAIPVEPAGIIAVLLTREGFKPQILSGEKENADE